MSRKSAFDTCPQPTLPVFLMFEFVEVLCQTIFYGIFLAVVPVCVHTFFKHGLKVRSSVIMVSITMFMFSISTVHWCISVMMITSLISSSNVSGDTGRRQLLNAIALINYCFADGVLVWRMRVLCSSWFSGRHLIIPVTTLIMTFLSVITTISIRIMMISAYRNADAAETRTLNKAIGASQIATMVFSLITNAIATSLIGGWAWEYRQSIRATLSMTVKASGRSPVERVLALLAESGLIYILSSIFVLASAFIRLPCGTVGDVYVPIHAQIAGMYPAVVMTLINSGRSSDSFASDHRSYVLNSTQLRRNAIVLPSIQPTSSSQLGTGRETESVGDGILNPINSQGRFAHINLGEVMNELQIMTV